VTKLRRSPVLSLQEPACSRGGRVESVVVVLLACSLAGCIRWVPDTIDRSVGGERRRGPWVPPSGYEHFVRAELAMEHREYRAAIGEYELARSGVIDGYLLAREAEAAALVPDLALAERLLEEGLSSDPDSEPLLLLRARLARERGDIGAAEAALRAAHDAAPEAAAPTLALAELLAQSDRGAEALAVLDAFVLSRPRDVPALRVLLAQALVAGDVRRASLAALRLVRASPVHRHEVRAAIQGALAHGQAPLAHAIWRALPLAEGELDVRFTAALAVGDRDECERLALRMDDGTTSGRLRAAERWIELGDGAHAEELAREVLLEGGATTLDPRAQRIVAHALVLEGHFARAAELLAAMPAGTSEEAARRTLFAVALERAGLPMLAREATTSTR
jgi:thioredoxin-like negative regulator of GroEL